MDRQIGRVLQALDANGGLYPLPRRPTFRFRNVLHLVEARDRVAHV